MGKGTSSPTGENSNPIVSHIRNPTWFHLAMRASFFPCLFDNFFFFSLFLFLFFLIEFQLVKWYILKNCFFIYKHPIFRGLYFLLPHFINVLNSLQNHIKKNYISIFREIYLKDYVLLFKTRVTQMALVFCYIYISIFFNFFFLMLLHFYEKPFQCNF